MSTLLGPLPDFLGLAGFAVLVFAGVYALLELEARRWRRARERDELPDWERRR